MPAPPVTATTRPSMAKAAPDRLGMPHLDGPALGGRPLGGEGDLQRAHAIRQRDTGLHLPLHAFQEMTHLCQEHRVALESGGRRDRLPLSRLGMPDAYGAIGVVPQD